MRLSWLIAAVMLAGCVAKDASPGGQWSQPSDRPVQPPLPSIEEQLRMAFRELIGPSDIDPPPPITIELQPVAGRPHEYVAIVDAVSGWWGQWCWLSEQDGAIAAITWGGQDEQAMHKLRAFSHSLWDGVIVEAYGMTHMGNGSYYLFHVHHGRIETLIQTRAVDAHVGGDGAVLQESDDYVMPARYYDFDKDGFTDVVLQGRVVTVEEPDWYDWSIGWDGLERPVRKVFLWDPQHAAFERAHWLDIGSFD